MIPVAPKPSPDEAVMVLKSEVARAERGSYALSVILLRMRRLVSGTRTRDRIERRLASLVRISDEARWYDGRHFVLLLPNTELEGAGLVLQRISNRVWSNGFDPEVRIVDNRQSSDVLASIRDYTGLRR